MKLINNILNFLFVSEKRKLNNKILTNILGNEQFKYLKTKHSWHLVDPSPWPLVASLGAFL